MKKTAVIYWSGTGNTESMAKAVLQGMIDSGADAELYFVSDVSVELFDLVEAVALGCPAMGAEVLEEDEFEPMFESYKDKLAGKKVALFGSYGWGDGEWMRSWEENCNSNGINLCTESVICNDAPDDEIIDQCKKLGKVLAE